MTLIPTSSRGPRRVQAVRAAPQIVTDDTGDIDVVELVEDEPYS